METRKLSHRRSGKKRSKPIATYMLRCTTLGSHVVQSVQTRKILVPNQLSIKQVMESVVKTNRFEHTYKTQNHIKHLRRVEVLKNLLQVCSSAVSCGCCLMSWLPCLAWKFYKWDSTICTESFTVVTDIEMNRELVCLKEKTEIFLNKIAFCNSGRENELCKFRLN